MFGEKGYNKYNITYFEDRLSTVSNRSFCNEREIAVLKDEIKDLKQEIKVLKLKNQYNTDRVLIDYFQEDRYCLCYGSLQINIDSTGKIYKFSREDVNCNVSVDMYLSSVEGDRIMLNLSNSMKWGFDVNYDVKFSIYKDDYIEDIVDKITDAPKKQEQSCS